LLKVCESFCEGVNLDAAQMEPCPVAAPKGLGLPLLYVEREGHRLERHPFFTMGFITEDGTPLITQLPNCKKLLEKLPPHPENLWSINGVYYDLKEFTTKHPGGPDFVTSCRGTDCTELFESHHVNIDLVTKMLSKHTSDVTPYERDNTKATFKTDGFYDRVRRRVYNMYPMSENRRTTPEAMACLIGTLICAALVNGMSYYVTPGFTLSWFLVWLGCTFINTLMGGYGHNYCHIAKSSLCCMLDFNGLSAAEWMIEHIQSHHMHTNTELDHDCHSMEPFIHWLPTEHKSPFVKGLSFLVQMVIYAIAEMAVPIHGNLVHSFRHKFNLTAHGGSLFAWIYPARVFSLMLVHGPLLGLFGFVSLSMGASVYFASLAHSTHMSHDALAAGDLNYRGEEEGLDWGFSQLATSKDIAAVNLPGIPAGMAREMSRAILLGLDRQSMHHLFPSIDHSCCNDEVRKIVLEELDTENKRYTAAKDEKMLKLIDECIHSVTPISFFELIRKSFSCAHAFDL